MAQKIANQFLLPITTIKIRKKKIESKSSVDAINETATS
uniref:Uncharacterized protein n=1 Tax=Rhizophora mucronata TaxID=61149 RepID=A0A2P2IQX3_RHIMU